MKWIFVYECLSVTNRQPKKHSSVSSIMWLFLSWMLFPLYHRTHILLCNKNKNVVHYSTTQKLYCCTASPLHNFLRSINELKSSNCIASAGVNFFQCFANGSFILPVTWQKVRLMVRITIIIISWTSVKETQQRNRLADWKWVLLTVMSGSRFKIYDGDHWTYRKVISEGSED